jgi:hypothetical protein
MKPKTYKILTDCIENGVEYGWSRAHKHTDQPNPNTVKECIEDAIMLEISENFSFEDDD